MTIPKSVLRRLALAVAGVVLLAALVLAAVALARSLGSGTSGVSRGAGSSPDTLGAAINSSEYQAVFLANGQVYFGKLSAPGGDFYYLRHVYYLSTLGAPLSRKAPSQQLIKLGNEIHGPEDLMILSRSQILFVENLKRSGQVTQAILRNGG